MQQNFIWDISCCDICRCRFRNTTLTKKVGKKTYYKMICNNIAICYWKKKRKAKTWVMFSSAWSYTKKKICCSFLYQINQSLSNTLFIIYIYYKIKLNDVWKVIVLILLKSNVVAIVSACGHSGCDET